MKHQINKIKTRGYGYSEVFEIIDKNGKVVINKEEKFTEISFLNDDTIYYERFTYTPPKKLYCYYFKGILNLRTGKEIYGENLREDYNSFSVSKFSNNLLKVGIENEKTRFYNTEGDLEFELNFPFESLFDFNENLIGCYDNQFDDYLFDTKSLEIIPIKFEKDFLLKNYKKIDYSIEFGIKDEGLVPYYDWEDDEEQMFFGGGKIWGFKDINGITVVPCQFKEVRSFFNGKAAVYLRKKGRWAYINSKGDYITSPIFTSASNFNSNVAFVSTLTKQGYFKGIINENGQYVLLPQFDQILISKQSKEKLILRKKKIGFLGKEGKWEIKPKFEAITKFSKNKCEVMKDGLWGIINVKGEWIISPKFKSLNELI